MKLVKSFNSTIKGDAPIAILEKHQSIANQFLVGAFSCMQKSTTPLHPDNTYWNNLSFILNYNKDQVSFGGYGRFQSYVSIALLNCLSSDDEKEYAIEVPSIFSNDNKVKSFTGNIHAYIANECAIQLATTIRKYMQNNAVAQQNPLINLSDYERSQFTAPDGIVFQDMYRFLYTNLLVCEIRELES